MMRIFLGFMLLLAASAVPWRADAQVYKYRDENGILHYTDRKPPEGQRYAVIRIKCRGCDWHRKVNWQTVALNVEAFTDEILNACERHGVDESFVRAVIHAESWFKRDAVSNVGAQGLMQLMPETQKRFGVTQPFDAGQNIDAGVRYLRELLDLFGNDYRLASAAFNAGENAVKRFGGVPPYNETENFVKRVRILRSRYREALI
ncbi:MAG: lytic transglycosylase domain-containing protein [Pseudomonadota bacterium]